MSTEDGSNPRSANGSQIRTIDVIRVKKRRIADLQSLRQEHLQQRTMSFPASKLNLTDLTNMLNCSVCYKMMKPHIFQCCNGHAVCNDCNPKLTQCPICRTYIMGIRNLVADHISASLRHSCAYADAGCGEKFYIEKLQDHEKLCSYRPFQCPLRDSNNEQCIWHESLRKFKDHVASDHSNLSIKVQESDFMRFSIPFDFSGVSYLKNFGYRCIHLAFEKLFLIRLGRAKNEHTILVFVKHMSPECDTEKFKYIVTCTFPNIQMKLISEIPVHSYAERAEHIFESKCCFTLTDDLIAKFTPPRSNFQLSLKIKKLR